MARQGRLRPFTVSSYCFGPLVSFLGAFFLFELAQFASLL